QLSLATHPWLADHAVSGTVLLPASAFVDLALHAADQVGCDEIAELTLEAPLVVPDAVGIRLQLIVGAGDDPGRRTVSIHSCPASTLVEGTRSDRAWTRHATGILTSTDGVLTGTGTTASVAAPDDLAGAWPPADA
ncbi:polyketide synthase dehydratase domain-containing protein, partial [Frankia sp. CiP3]